MIWQISSGINKCIENITVTFERIFAIEKIAKEIGLCDEE